MGFIQPGRRGAVGVNETVAQIGRKMIGAAAN